MVVTTTSNTAAMRGVVFGRLAKAHLRFVTFTAATYNMVRMRRLLAGT
jgi:hypothetical protein